MSAGIGFRLDGRIAIVTGASRGIGASMARAIDAAGGRVALVARTRDDLEAVAEGLNNDPMVVTADLLEPDACRVVTEQVVSQAGGVDILVNNSGLSRPAPAVDVSLADWDDTLALNLRAAFALSQQVAPTMIERGGGKVVNVASVMALRGDSFAAAYAASKSGMLGLTRSLAVEWARHGIQVNALCPGWIETEMVSALRADERFERRVLRSVPQHRWGLPEDMDGPLVFLCSSASDFVTGQTLVADGGLTAGW